ncbi:UNVERIFIED_CONTAM: hypothetical protein FKN15_000242 [Acipenser sinensis]
MIKRSKRIRQPPPHREDPTAFTGKFTERITLHFYQVACLSTWKRESTRD